MLLPLVACGCAVAARPYPRNSRRRRHGRGSRDHCDHGRGRRRPGLVAARSVATRGHPSGIRDRAQPGADAAVDRRARRRAVPAREDDDGAAAVGAAARGRRRRDHGRNPGAAPRDALGRGPQRAPCQRGRRRRRDRLDRARDVDRPGVLGGLRRGGGAARRRARSGERAAAPGARRGRTSRRTHRRPIPGGGDRRGGDRRAPAGARARRGRRVRGHDRARADTRRARRRRRVPRRARRGLGSGRGARRRPAGPQRRRQPVLRPGRRARRTRTTRRAPGRLHDHPRPRSVRARIAVRGRSGAAVPAGDRGVGERAVATRARGGGDRAREARRAVGHRAADPAADARRRPVARRDARRATDGSARDLPGARRALARPRARWSPSGSPTPAPPSTGDGCCSSWTTTIASSARSRPCSDARRGGGRSPRSRRAGRRRVRPAPSTAPGTAARSAGRTPR